MRQPPINHGDLTTQVTELPVDDRRIVCPPRRYLTNHDFSDRRPKYAALEAAFAYSCSRSVASITLQYLQRFDEMIFLTLRIGGAKPGSSRRRTRDRNPAN